MAQEIIEGINPTRMELLKLKQREKLAVKGYNLLKEKRNALIMEFFNILERVRGARERVEEKLKDAFKDLTEAQIMMGDMAVNKAAMAVKEFIKVEIDSRNIMGVVVPVVDIESTERSMVERGYGLVDTSVKLDEAAKKFEESVSLIVELGEIEKSVRLLAGEIESTKRRVNALENIIIPRLQNTVNYIEMRLEEMERENFVRLKMIKESMEME
ncbi:MAG TPA: V-type ATP synthase subunit D [Methanothermobacter sp.]|uniref:A-type ATP synthase subunit D n=1 Tax=Methanothermobacter tenebrarum TaxID=680118 RepID=A0ABM7YC96_9EURY|nr:V-type ATP synthase subunit D [Methanothermobacter tenebrarum]MBK6586593.1 V-type ATP synthase subunit D [Coprothermobacter sp.]MDI6881918.1 V-type ATP synthase subunit D [Methanothermobacter sp.]MDX9692722.1 V-type ATP synthase subunit D [Methanothermobacter sp.]BDH79080.1 V-type ATP synthase subunit D [Methanothermobacter tenebrarum]HHW16977.1 V-type ATP synthase subunit D [Methanothermobacter sp.]